MPPALGGGREAYDAVTARAVASLAVLVEYAAPLLRPGGVLVAWKGARDADEERGRGGGRRAARDGGRGGAARRAVRGRARPPPARVPQDRAHARAASRAGRDGGASARSAEQDFTVRRRTNARAAVPTGPDRSFEPAWAPFSQSPTRRAGSARPPPPSTSAPRSPTPAIRRCWSTSTRSATPRLRLGLPKDGSPNVYDCLSGELTLADAALPSGVEHLDVVPSTPELAGANVELPRIAGSETILRGRLGAVRRALPVHPARLPALARAAHRQRARRRRQGDRARCRPSTSPSRASPSCSTRSR